LEKLGHCSSEGIAAAKQVVINPIQYKKCCNALLLVFPKNGFCNCKKMIGSFTGGHFSYDIEVKEALEILLSSFF
jgi:hypothetical protein